MRNYGPVFFQIKLRNAFLLSCLLMTTFVWSQSVTLPSGFAGKAVAEGLNPTCMALAPDGRIFLAQKDGRVLIYHTDDGELHDEPFLMLQTDPFNEQGLNGLALHPDFELEPWVYVYYTLPGGQRNRLSRFLANGDFAVPGSEQVLLDLDPVSGSIHNGGALVFGPDDKLYIGVGDGAKSNNGQDLNTVLGKILRLNADGTIPVGNPFYDQFSGNNRAIYAYGVRNPFSMSMDPASGKIYFCDVGAEAWEEVNELQAGANYGWKLFQGDANTFGFTDPVYAYDHDAGCAIVGAAFPFQGQSLIPDQYQNRFLFADYCFGWIGMLNPTTGAMEGSFASDIDRPVSLLAGPGGDLYFLARAGLGGGSPIDNTASTEGVLWRVFWVGEGAPLITGQPQSVLVAEGESAFFQMEAYGGQPLSYQWYRDDILMSGADSSRLELDNLSLSDSGSTVFCVVTNAWGVDTSQAALIGVSSNRRPEPEILLPTVGQHYRGGDTLFFSGRSIDPDDGLLDATQLSWRIDFHHADHSHPGLPTTTGISEGMYIVPTVGEVSADVFFRIYLTARDQEGFVKTVFRDVLPGTRQILIDGPPGISVNLDGQLQTLPATVESVIGLNRIAEAPVQQQLADTVFLFREWENGSTVPLRSFAMPDADLSLEVFYDSYFFGNGTGLLGHYFFDPEGDFDEIPVMTRIDSMVNFIWDNVAPDSLLPLDYFTVRWMGFVQPLFSENYTFFVRSDDGCRLWVNDQLIIDQWIPQATTEHTGSLVLESGKKYRIRLEYLEIAGGANVQLFWSSPHQSRELVPKRQLYPPAFTMPATISGTVGLDSDNDGIWEAGESTFINATVRLYEVGTDSLIAETKTVAKGRYAFLDLPAGDYYIRVILPATGDILLPVQNVDADGQSPPVSIVEGEFKTLDVAWAVTMIALGGVVWLDENFDGIKDSQEQLLKSITVLLYQADSVLVSASMTNDFGEYGFSLVEPGSYFLAFLHQFVATPLIPGFGLNNQGQTAVFDIGQGEFQVRDVAFVPDTITTGLQYDPALQPLMPALVLYPNPATDLLNLRFEVEDPSVLPDAVQVWIFDMSGRMVLETRLTSLSGKNVQPVDISALAPGQFVLYWAGNGMQGSQVFFKE